MSDASTSTIADVQGSPDSRQLPIDKVGIRDIRHPVRVAQRDGGEQHTVATFSLYVDLPHHFKGTHMSRFVEVLEENEREISVPALQAMLPRMTERLGAESGHIEMTFPYFLCKTAPVTAVESVMDYEVTFTGDLVGGETRMGVRVTVPVTSLCPCSKEISRYGAHNQRSHVTVTTEVRDFLWVEELIELVEAESSSELYGLLKRPDEKMVTERAYENPKFVEDIVRDVARRLEGDPRLVSYTVEAENFESIHNHSAYAMIRSDS